MSEEGAKPQDQRLLGPARAWVAGHPTVSAVALYSLIAVGAAVAAYFALFTQFGSGDDEGTLLVSLKAFTDGESLYRDAYSPYGPFYYEVFGALFKLTGIDIANDASRLLVTGIWVGVSCMYGVAVQRLTGRLLLGASGMMVAFAVLNAFTNEPMHPQVLVAILFAGLTLLLASGPARRVGLAGAGAGAIVAALVLTKVNVGGLAVAALVLAAVLTIEPLYRRRWLRWPVIAGFLVLPLALMARHLEQDWVRDLIALELFAAVSLLVAATLLRPRRGEADDGLSRWTFAALAGFGAAFAAIVACLLLTGPTLGDLFDGTVVQPLKLGKIFILPFTSPSASLDWGIAAVAASLLTVALRGDGRGAPSIWPGLARIAVGLTIWLTVAGAMPFSPLPGGNQLDLPLVLAWVAVVPTAGAEEPAYRRFVRLALAALAVSETLQIYPVAGSQVGLAASCSVAVGAICLADGLAGLRAWSAARGTRALERFGTVTAVLLVALAGKMALDAIVRPAATNAVLYHRQAALPFDGATLLHPPDEQGNEYVRLVDLIHRYRCTNFIGYPNVNSLYLWSGITPPRPSAPGAWVAVMDGDEQQRIVDEMRAMPRPCALRKDPLADAWLAGTPPPDTPLVNYIFNEFEPVATVNEWSFELPESR